LGDCIISRKVSVQQDPGFLKLVSLIRSADCTWANCELPIVDINQAYSQYRDMDIPGAAEPWCADELKWLGVDFVGFANNHTMDYGHEGLFSTIENLNRVGIEYAGAGKDLEEAARPRYVDTPGGRIGQVNCTSAIHPGTHASLPSPYIRGRPGLNPLRVEDTIRLKKESYEALKKIIDEMDSLFREKEEEKKETAEHKEEKQEDKKETGEDKEKNKDETK
jgi:poly-gamma-glutamate capsule biosynthesis protein CapA/YwtB (metallophosphatase superfamily)